MISKPGSRAWRVCVWVGAILPLCSRGIVATSRTGASGGVLSGISTVGGPITAWHPPSGSFNCVSSYSQPLASTRRAVMPQPRAGASVLTRRGGSATLAAATPTAAAPVFVESYDGLRKHQVAWDRERKSFSVVTEPSEWTGFINRSQRFLRQCFLPENVTPDYYTYTKWRILQRLVSATISVFGTRALLLALGVKTERVGLTATFNWIQKDAFGKFGRIMWASKMGRRFDSDAKRWRFRSSLLYAAGTGLEVLTYVFPSAFLVLATIANTLKQMSMLTSSATRNAMYKSFAGDAQNLGDITAKGEAQIAVVDLVGILLGISLSKLIGTAHLAMGVAYLTLSVVDVVAIYNEIRSVVFTSLNLERGALIIRQFVEGGAAAIPAPQQVSRIERIFLNPRSIDAGRVFRTVSQTGCSMDEVQRVREVFDREPYMVTLSASMGPSIVLHAKAKDDDILRALLVWGYLREKWEQQQPPPAEGSGSSSWHLRLVREAYEKARSVDDGFREALAARGWDVKHMVFGKIKARTEW